MCDVPFRRAPGRRGATLSPSPPLPAFPTGLEVGSGRDALRYPPESWGFTLLGHVCSVGSWAQLDDAATLIILSAPDNPPSPMVAPTTSSEPVTERTLRPKEWTTRMTVEVSGDRNSV